MKLWFIILLIIPLILISGCVTEDHTPSSGIDCDGICDEFERQHHDDPCYSDCLDATEPGDSHTIKPPPIFHDKITVNKIDSEYKYTSDKPTGWFINEQNADILLSGFDFNDAGGALLFNHQGGIATDDKKLILADRNNNRVLIWNNIPEGNVQPDIVLGQTNFKNNNPGDTLDKLNWPVGVATDGKRLIIADTYNDRILIWNNFPTKNGQTADFELKKAGFDSRGTIGWPWAVWTDGQKLIVTSTSASQVLIWNTFPNENIEPDIVLKLNDFGTPRTIGSDGTNLIIGDHNAFKKDPGNFFWKTFPTEENQMYDFFMKNALSIGKGGMDMSEIFWGPTFTDDGKLITISNELNIWNSFPENENDLPDISIGRVHNDKGYEFGGSQSGDGSGISLAGGKLYISLSNGNKIVGFDNLPQRSDQEPDFVIGSPDIYTNTLQTEFIISNPIPVTDGNSLFVSSDFDRKLYVWKHIPDESGVKPDFVYSLTDAPWDNALFGDFLVLAGKNTVFLWNNIPRNGEEPDTIFNRNIGSIVFKELSGVAIDKKYFYLADSQANKIYVWENIPQKNSEPVFSIDIQRPQRLSSDGEHLVVAATETNPGGSVMIYKINELPDTEPTILNGMFNLPQGVLIYNGHLFVGDTGFNAVHIWKNIEDAISGKNAEIMLGKKGMRPEIGLNRLFFPAVPTFDGSYLWIGEFKFSERLLRFSVQ